MDYLIIYFIIMLICAIFGIILYIKIWKMTDNVKRIYTDIELQKKDYQYYMLIGDKDKAFEALQLELINSLKAIWNDDDFSLKAKKLIDYSIIIAKATGHELPVHLTSVQEYKKVKSRM